MQWTDATSYSRSSPRGEAPQTSWEINVEGVRLWVSCGHKDFDGDWILNCDALGIHHHVLTGRNASSETARDLALELIWQRAALKSQQMQSLSDAAFAAKTLSK